MILLLSIFISTAVYITYDLLNTELWISYAFLLSMIILFYPIVVVQQFSILKVIRNVFIIAILYLIIASVFYIIFPFGLRSDLPSLLVEDNIYLYIFVITFIALAFAMDKKQDDQKIIRSVLNLNFKLWSILMLIIIINIFFSNRKSQAESLDVSNKFNIVIVTDSLKNILMKSENWRVARIKESIFNDALVATMREPMLNTRIFNDAGFLGTFQDKMIMIKIPYFKPNKRLNGRGYEICNNLLIDSVLNINFFYSGYKDPYFGYTDKICHVDLKGEEFGVELYATNPDTINVLLDDIDSLLSNNIRFRSYNPADLDSLTKMDYRSFSRNEYGYFKLYGFSGDLQTIKNGEFIPSYGKMIQGYINEGKGGRLYVKVQEIDRNSMISIRSVLAETKVSCIYPEEYVGWSENENEMFYFEIPFEYKNGYQKFLEKFELWFDPESNEEDYIIYEETYENKLILNSEKLVLE